jgi:hypothetical protein
MCEVMVRFQLMRKLFEIITVLGGATGGRAKVLQDFSEELANGSQGLLENGAQFSF